MKREQKEKPKPRRREDPVTSFPSPSERERAAAGLDDFLDEVDRLLEESEVDAAAFVQKGGE